MSIASEFNESMTGMVNDVIEIMGYDIFGDERFKTIGNAIKTVNADVIVPFAIYTMLIFFIIGLVDKMSSENFTWEQLGRQLAMFFLAYGLMLYGLDILMLMMDMGRELLTLVKDKLSAGDIPDAISQSMVDDYVDNFTIFGVNIKFLGGLVANVALLIPWLLSWLVRIAANIICYSRLIEIYGRAAFAPIAFSDFFQNGFNGAGWNFLKSFAAVCVQGTLIAVIALVFSRLTSAIMFTPDGDVNLFTTAGKALALSAAACMLMFKSLSITKELFGVR